MAKSDTRTVAISEELWAKLKQRALDERVTLREVVERACHQYLGVPTVRELWQARPQDTDPKRQAERMERLGDAVREMRVVPEEHIP